MDSTGDLSRYRHISPLGSGGMATVDLAEDTVLGRLVALKRMSGAADAHGLSRLRREALAGASVSHPNVVSIYDVVTADDDHLIIVMEYINGETLREALQREGRLPAAEALRILEGVAAGLDAIHARGIVHRDVKPSNILLGADGAVKVADLGIASVPDGTRITTSGAVLGSLSYMAPEQLGDAPSTLAVDTYALAAVAFEVLSGEKARRAANPVALAHAIASQPPPSLREAWPSAPRATADLLLRAMAREPSARPASASELIRRLRAGLEPQTTARMAPARSAASPPVTAAGGMRARSLERAQPPARAPARAADPLRPPRSPRPAAVPERTAGAGRGPGPPTAHRSRADAGPGVTGGGGSGGGSGRRTARLMVAGLVGLVGVAVVIAILVNTGSGGSPKAGTSASSGQASHSHAATGPKAASSTQSGSATTVVPAATSAPAPAGDPVSAVKSFYGLAAAHRYSEAWTLADPTMQQQLGGYASFQAGQANDRSITFDSARTVSRSSDGATVSVHTTSVQTTGTQSCSGTVDLASSGSSGPWRLHLIHITCS